MSSTRLRLRNEWLLPCGCIAELEPAGYRMAWVITERCDEHPTGDVPVPSMALLDPRREALGA